MTELEIIEKILRHWNPIGIDSNKLPSDEYDSYAPMILNSVKKNEVSQEISKSLAHLHSYAMGLGSNIPTKKEIRIANILVQWREEKYNGIPYF